jgi:hypothetical protein
MKRPPITYTWSEEFAIAYQIVGEGPIDLVYLPPWCSNLDGNWMWSHHALPQPPGVLLAPDLV